MGRRSNLKRIGKDAYDTIDGRAFPPLLRQLKRPVKYWEPCAGEGRLVDALSSQGHHCVAATDIQPRDEGIYRLDALRATAEDVNATGAEFIITNPVWSRPLMHAMIDHFSKIRPTWLLFDAAWMHTVQDRVAKRHGVKTAPELLMHCHKIVTVGRLIWIPGTSMAGKDDVCWYLFDQSTPRTTAHPVFEPALPDLCATAGVLESHQPIHL